MPARRNHTRASRFTPPRYSNFYDCSTGTINVGNEMRDPQKYSAKWPVK